MSVKPSSVARIVAKFGGQNAMARAMGISQGTVWGWVTANQIPQSRWPAVRAAARRHTPPFEVKADDFVDFDDEPAESAEANAA